MVDFGFSSRFGGVSKAPFDTLNLGFHTGDAAAAVAKNRELLKREIKAGSLVFMEQIHSDYVLEVTSENLSDFAKTAPKCDALFTRLLNVGLCVMVADCAPIIVSDEKQGIIAAIHAGRAGVCAKILSKCVQEMKSEPKDLKIIIGAHIKGSCYEIGDMNLGEFNAYKNGGFFDITAALRAEINALGATNYEISEICSHCDKNYFSYRRDGKTGRFAGWVIKR
ncbi:peptidoglycan editing factor PgeF [Campylobacter sp.]|uniref:peptidoglycan editing factor PgeF n=1 Tax=Campylobacter sp. TaxID=205 RepID=UPI002A5F0F15|nr:peptidoglycan editing factor PgeF [Campylobacter sp.]MDD7704090.1 peptidoglycan editing factor PgeF [Campylobacteraceae bacterium]MDY2635670.1 peptidoglycan editing factor PgeF [Campylobacter sp.]